MRITCGTLDSPLGTLGVGVTEGAVAFLIFADSIEQTLEQCAQYYPHAGIIMDQDAVQFVQPWLNNWLEGKPLPNNAIYMQGTPFQVKVWKAIRDIPHGQTRTYKEIARIAGNPAAIRAAGTACGANPVCLFVPCHRVVSSSGGLGGYAGGLEKKIKLLKREAA